MSQEASALPVDAPAETPPAAGKPRRVKDLAPMPSAIATADLRRAPQRDTSGRGSVHRHHFKPEGQGKKGLARVAAATGVPGTSAELPDYLRGPSAEDARLRSSAREARHNLALIVTTLQNLLPGAAASLKALEDAGDAGQTAAASQGLQIQPARELLEKLRATLP